MSNINIVGGEQVTIGVKNQTASGIAVVDQPTTSVSVAGLVGGKGDSHFVFTQSVPESIWEITHNLAKKPSVTVVDSGDSVVVGEVEYINLNSVRLTFAGAFSGKAYFN
jgi:hypothetical protein